MAIKEMTLEEKYKKLVNFVSTISSEWNHKFVNPFYSSCAKDLLREIGEEKIDKVTVVLDKQKMAGH